jgi:hypothetical protein
MSLIIPEVIEREIKEKDSSSTLNINLNKYENNRTYNKVDNSKHDNVINNISESKGFFKLILEIVTFPFRVVYNFFKGIIIKYDFAGNYNNFIREQRDIEKKKKTLSKVYKLNKFDDEIF